MKRAPLALCSRWSYASSHGESSLFVKLIRSAALLVLLSTLVVAPAVAACAADAESGCCCSNSKNGKCHKPAQRQAPSAKCCESPAEASPLTAAPSTVDPLPTMQATDDESLVAEAARALHATAPDTRALDPPGVRLYTLHAAFLI